MIIRRMCYFIFGIDLHFDLIFKFLIDYLTTLMYRGGPFSCSRLINFDIVFMHQYLFNYHSIRYALKNNLLWILITCACNRRNDRYRPVLGYYHMVYYYALGMLLVSFPNGKPTYYHSKNSLTKSLK